MPNRLGFRRESRDRNVNLLSHLAILKNTLQYSILCIDFDDYVWSPHREFDLHAKPGIKTSFEKYLASGSKDCPK
jgi:hypothetical protein